MILDHAEEWLKILDAQSLDSGNEELSSAFKLLDTDGGLGEPCAVVEWKVLITGASTDDVTLRLYGAPDGEIAAKGSEAKQAFMLNCGGVDPYRQDGILNWDEVGSGGVFTFKRSASEDGIAVTLWIRRNRWN